MRRRQIERQIYSGEVILTSSILAAHKVEALGLIRNEEESRRLSLYQKYVPDIEDSLPVDAAARPSGFILSTSCEIPPKSDPEVVKWFMDAAHEYGRYDRIFM